MSDHYWHLWWEKTGVADSENTIIMRIFVLIVVIKVCPTPRIKQATYVVLPNFQASLLNQYQEWQSHSLVACHADRERQQGRCLTSALPFFWSGFPWHSRVSRIPPLLTARMSRQTLDCWLQCQTQNAVRRLSSSLWAQQSSGFERLQATVLSGVFPCCRFPLENWRKIIVPQYFLLFCYHWYSL